MRPINQHLIQQGCTVHRARSVVPSGIEAVWPSIVRSDIGVVRGRNLDDVGDDLVEHVRGGAQ